MSDADRMGGQAGDTMPDSWRTREVKAGEPGDDLGVVWDPARKAWLSPPAPALPPMPTMAVEWQVTMAGQITTYVLTDEAAVKRVVAELAATFMAEWDPARSSRFGVEVRRVERQRVAR